MAIKRTILRQNFVTNTAMPESAGLAMAQASREIAGAITSITNTVDKSQLIKTNYKRLYLKLKSKVKLSEQELIKFMTQAVIPL